MNEAAAPGYTSAHFGDVPPQLRPPAVGNLIHRDVRGSAAANDRLCDERRHRVVVVDLPSRVLSMTIGELEPGQKTRRHRHNYETLLYIIDGTGRSVIGNEQVDWTAGDAVYIPVWAWHQHINISDSKGAVYIACENAPHLLNLGIALREEA